MVRDNYAPAWWTLADAAGNECDVSSVETRERGDRMEVLPKAADSKGSSDIFVGDVWVDRVASGDSAVAHTG